MDTETQTEEYNELTERELPRYYINRAGEKVSIEKNTSGIQPVEDKVLLLPDQVLERKGVIHKPEVAIQQEQMAQVRALLIAAGGNAFEDWDWPYPQEGDRVMVCKYAGILDIPGADGLTYQLCTDRDITAIIVDDLEPEGFLGTRQPLSRQKGE